MDVAELSGEQSKRIYRLGRIIYVEKILATIGAILMTLSVYVQWPYAVTIALAVLVIVLVFLPSGKK